MTTTTKGLAPEYSLSSYVYELPPERIARRPCAERASSRLLVLDRNPEAKGGAEGEAQPEDMHFADLPEILAKKFPQGGLLVANNSRVLQG